MAILYLRWIYMNSVCQMESTSSEIIVIPVTSRSFHPKRGRDESQSWCFPQRSEFKSLTECRVTVYGLVKHGH